MLDRFMNVILTCGISVSKAKGKCAKPKAERRGGAELRWALSYPPRSPADSEAESGGARGTELC
jgi:hypothetical protein